MKYIIIIIMLLIYSGCGLVDSEDISPYYSDIQGDWMIIDSGRGLKLADGSRMYKAFMRVQGDSIYVYDEMYMINNGAYTYHYTEQSVGTVFRIGEGHKNGAAKGKSIVNMELQMVLASGYGILAPAIVSMSLEQLYGDTLAVKYCLSTDCYVNQFGSPDECYSDHNTFVRYNELDIRKSQWKYL